MAYGQAARDVTPSDTVDLPAAVRPSGYLYIGGAGNLTVIQEDGETQTYPNCPIGFAPIRATRVMLTGTDASAIVALKG